MALVPFNNDEILEIANSLEDYHKVFYTFFEMSAANFCDDEDGVPTACVKFFPGRKPELVINRSFWDEKNHREKLWIICHECLHVILCHDERMGQDVPGATPIDVNRAQDITINEMFVDLFGFNRDDIRDWKRYCWIDTCFEAPQIVKRNETFTYYLELLVKEKKDLDVILLDMHPGAGGDGNQTPSAKADDGQDGQDKDKMKEVAGKLAEELTADELETLMNAFPNSPMAGSLAGMFDAMIGEKQKKAKVDFGKIVRHLKRTRIKPKHIDAESFVRDDRRFDDVVRRGNVVMPGKHEVEKPSKDRLLTVLFMDISGSCIHHLGSFNKVYSAFDAERDLFEIRSFAFDTKCVEIHPGDRVRMGGGTNFAILEQKVQELKTEYKKYPDAVFVITDGDGSDFAPEAPNRWVFLLTDHPSLTYIPATSKHWDLSQIVW